MLLDAEHIIPDPDEELGQPIVPNGLPLSKIHHAARSTQNLILVDADGVVHGLKSFLKFTTVLCSSMG